MDLQLLDATADDRAGKRVVTMEMSSRGCQLTATLGRTGDLIECLSMSITCEQGVPPSARRLPSDTTLIRLLRERPEYLAHLWEVTLHSDSISDQSVLEETVRSQLVEVGRIVTEGGRHRPDLVIEARRLIDAGITSTVIVQQLMAQGVSDSTAWRILRRARKSD